MRLPPLNLEAYYNESHGVSVLDPLISPLKGLSDAIRQSALKRTTSPVEIVVDPFIHSRLLQEASTVMLPPKRIGQITTVLGIKLIVGPYLKRGEYYFKFP
jgi:hypothetical protein